MATMATMATAGQGAIFGMGMGSMNHASQSRAQRNRELYEMQKRARRGPTPEVFFVKHIDNSRIVKADDPERRREMRSLHHDHEHSVSAGDDLCVAALFGDRDWLPGRDAEAAGGTDA